MCQAPLEINGYQVACRECDECCATYKNTWVARCLAEKETANYCFAVTLTYSDDESGERPLGAKVFRYSDVAKFWKRLRRRAKNKWGENLEFSYVVVGEKGSRFGRVHYHAVLFASHDITALGKFTRSNGEGFALKRRMNWDVWGHGFVEFQSVDRAGISYVMKYVLKDRMTAKRSQGNRREGKTEWLARSYLWCSKVPPIGARWLWRKLHDLRDVGCCPSSLRIPLPGGGQWYVNGPLQKQVCLWLREQNARFLHETGRNLAGWSTLLNSVSQEIERSDTGEIVSTNAKEWLTNGEEEKDEVGFVRPDWFERFESDYAAKRRTGARVGAARRIVAQCGNIEACKGCESVLGDASRAALQAEKESRYGDWLGKGYAVGESYDWPRQFEEWWRTRCRPSRGCQCREQSETIDAFRYVADIERARPYRRDRKAIGATLQKKTDRDAI